MRRLLGAMVVTLTVSAALPAAVRASVVIGSDLTGVPNANGTCGSGCTTVETQTTPNPIKSPMDGVIVAWSSRGGGDSNIGTFGNLRLRVLRSVSGSTFQAVRSGPVTAVASTGVTHDIFTVPVNPGVAISANDFVGLDLLDATSALAERTGVSASFTYAGWIPPLADGATAATTFGPFNAIREMLYQVRIEPDADHDGFGDETQDKCPGSPGPQQGCPVATPGATPTPTPQPTGPAAIVDGDHDGIADPADRCPTVPRGAFDRDNDGCPGPYRRIRAKLIGTWSVRDDGVTIGSMTFGPVPTGATIRLTCGACHARQRFTARHGTVSLKKLGGRLLKRGGSFTATATKPGFIGERITLTVIHYGHRLADFERTARKPFTRRTRCIPAGATRAVKTCSATPPTGP